MVYNMRLNLAEYEISLLTLHTQIMSQGFKAKPEPANRTTLFISAAEDRLLCCESYSLIAIYCKLHIMYISAKYFLCKFCTLVHSCTT